MLKVFYTMSIVFDIIVYIVCRKLFYKNEKDENLEYIIYEKYDFFNFSKEKFQKKYKEISKKYTFLENNSNGLKMEIYRIENIKTSIESNTNAIVITFIVLLVTTILTGVFDITNIWKDILTNPNNTNETTENLYLILFIKFLFFIPYLILTFVLGISFSKYIRMVRIYDLAIKVLNDMKTKIEEQKIKEEREEMEKERLKNMKILLENTYKAFNESAIIKEDKLKSIECSIEEIKRFVDIK